MVKLAIATPILFYSGMKARLTLTVLGVLSVCFGYSQLFAAPPGTGWELSVNDTFDGSMIDTEIWDIASGSARKDANTHLYRPQNVSLGTGSLKIKNKALSKGRFIGGFLSSKRRYKYGYFEIKCRVSQRTDNLMANFWLGNRKEPSIMVMGWDHIQFKQNLSPVQTHFISEKDQSVFFRKLVDPSKEHVYGLLWTPHELSFYLDGDLLGTSRRSDLAADMKPQRLYFSSNHDWTNKAGGKPDSLPLFIVDHIKIWQKDTGDYSLPNSAPIAASKHSAPSRSSQPPRNSPPPPKKTHQKGVHAVRVDTSRQSYRYDFGTIYSPVERGRVRISPYTSGDIHWLQQPGSVDRGADLTNLWNRDLVYSAKSCTLRHKLANGSWNVVLSMGDMAYPHDRMSVTVENTQRYRAKPVEAGEFANISFVVDVTDGWLDLTMTDGGGKDPSWVLSKMNITRF